MPVEVQCSGALRQQRQPSVVYRQHRASQRVPVDVAHGEVFQETPRPAYGRRRGRRGSGVVVVHIKISCLSRMADAGRAVRTGKRPLTPGKRHTGQLLYTLGLILYSAEHTEGRVLLPLSGVTVVTLEHAVAAPFATRQLADLGARVIKIERPGVGDFARAYDERVGGLASHFVWTNRSKESLTLDLKHPEAGRILAKLLST